MPTWQSATFGLLRAMRRIASSVASGGIAPARSFSTATKLVSARSSLSPRPVQTTPPASASMTRPAPIVRGSGSQGHGPGHVRRS